MEETMICKNLIVLLAGVLTLMILTIWANAVMNRGLIYEDRTDVQRLSDYVDQLEREAGTAYKS